jgi:hypothetical protein
LKAFLALTEGDQTSLAGSFKADLMPEMRGSDNGLLMGPYRQQPLSETSDTKFSSRHTNNNNGGGKLVLSQYNIGGGGGGSGSYHQPANDQSEE